METLLFFGIHGAYVQLFGMQMTKWLVVTSERPVIQTVMNVSGEDVHELDPGKALIIKKNGRVNTEQIREPFEKKSCSFERIYFSRGSDEDIYKERKTLGALLTQPIL